MEEKHYRIKLQEVEHHGGVYFETASCKSCVACRKFLGGMGGDGQFICDQCSIILSRGLLADAFLHKGVELEKQEGSTNE